MRTSRTIAVWTLLMLAGPAGAVGPISVDGQSRDDLRARVEAMPSTAVARAFIASRVTKGFMPPKTPWGDPDISGNFDTSPEANTPMQRPDEWVGREMNSITPKELADAIIARQRDAVERAPFAGGGEPEEGIAIAVPIHWFDNLAAVNSRPWFVIDPPSGRIPAVTRAAAQQETADAERQRKIRQSPGFRPGGTRDHYTERSAGERCIVFGSAWRTPIIYGNAHQLLQTRNYVVFRSEMIHEARVIPIDRSGHPSQAVKTHFGDSRAYWDGNSLVVETTNVHPTMRVQGASGATLRVVERLTRIAPDKVEWTVTLEDPTNWTSPWTYSYPMTINDEKPIFEYACHEGNFGMANLLTAGRQADKAGSQR